MIALADGETLAGFADEVLAAGPDLELLQAPTPQLVMQRVIEPVENRPFNLGEVLVTVAEVDLEGARGFAMVPGKNERIALAGAIVDAAVAGGHALTAEIENALEAAVANRDEERARAWATSRETTVEFESMEDEL